jgi:uroporphyrinogen decarboxylase
MLEKLYTGKKRFLAALDRQKPDRVPIFEINIDDISIVNLAGLLYSSFATVKVESLVYEKREEILELYCYLIKELDLDAVTSYPAIGMKNQSDKFGKDKFGVTYKYTLHGEPIVIHGPVQGDKDISGLNLIDKNKPDDFTCTEYLILKLGDEKAHVLNVPDPFELSWHLRGGIQNLLVDYIIDPDLVHNLAKITTEYVVAIMEKAKALGVDVIAIIGDLASSENIIFSPDQFREFILPYYKEIVSAAHNLGFRIIKHSKGMLWPIMDDIVESGFDGYHPIQPDCMDIGEFKEKYQNKICIVGNIDNRKLQCDQEEKEVEEVVCNTIKIAGADGGYIMCSCDSIHPDVKPENYITMVRATHKYGVYDRNTNRNQRRAYGIEPME